MPTLYDNFERVRQYIDQHQGGGGDMSAYVTKNELSAQSYLTSIPSTYASYNGVYSYLYDTLGISHGGSQGVSYIDAPELHDAELTGDISINGIHTDQLPTYAAISAMGYLTSIPSEYVTQDALSANSYLTEHQSLNSYVLAPTVVSNPTEPYRIFTNGLGANNQYHHFYPLAQSYAQAVSANANAWASVGTVRNYVEGRLAEIEASYITMGDVSACGYISAVSAGNFDSVVNLEGTSKIAAEDGLEIDSGDDFIYLNNQTFANDTLLSSNIIPQVSNTYTLGDGNNIYSNTYSRGVYLGTGVRMYSESSASSNDIAIALGGTAYYYMNNNRFAPNGAANSEKIDLGTADRKWNHIYGKSVNVDTTYTTNIYTENVSYTSHKSSIKLNDRNVDIWANNKKMVNVSDYNGVLPTQTNVNLGGSSNKWAATYTSNLYADNIHNFIWTGTSAEYAALSDYTTYQIYMIKES